jgi:NAD(P)H-hydrate repair Nnr-like enzyme with NAD(P)H-hydrate dehydratase domain
VLSGIAGAVLATGLSGVEAGAVAAHLHGRAGQLAAQRGPLIAGDLVRRLPEAVGRVRGLPPDRLGDSEA